MTASKLPLATLGIALSALDAEQDEVLYQNERTQVFRRHLAHGAGCLICKRPVGPKALVRLRHERRILERLAGVKGVRQPLGAAISVAEAIVFDDGDLVSLTDAMRDRRMALPTQLALMLQLTEIVAAVHRAGVIHKDISPANILLIGPERKPLLIDFDLATTFAEERPGFIQPQDIAGTLAYIAPEQTGRSGRAVDQRADLYSLGSVFYELAVGHPPFDASHDDPLQLIHQILARAPAAPAELDMRIPVALSDILLRLLEKEPDRRYQSAEGLKADLLRLREMLARGESGSFPLGEHDYPLRLLPPSRLIGREREIGILQSAFDNALHGRGSGVLVSGAPGVGKSALINELRPIVTARRGWFVSGKFDQYRQDVAGEATGQALRALIELILAEPEAELAQHKTRILKALGNNAGVMATVLPGFATTFDVTPEPVTGDPIQMAKRLIQAGLDLLRACASPQRPLVMVIDDLQWASAAALDFIDAIVTDDSQRGLLLVASYRESGVDATHPLAALLSRWERLDMRPMQLHLDNLPPGDLATLLADMLHLPAARAGQLAEAVGARTQGNPFDTVELVNALRHDGALTLGADGWQWDAATIQRYIGKGEVIDLLTARIARLPAAARSLLETMACLGGELAFGLLAAASGLTAAEAEEQLASALEDGLLVMESSNNTVRFRHDRVQQAAYAQLEPAARSALHLALARRVAAVPEFAAVAAEQYLSAIDAIDDNAERRRVVDLLHAAATQAGQVSNYMLTERLLEAALALLNKARSAREETQDEALLLALEIAQHAVLYSLGRLDEVDDVYASVKRRCRDPLGLVDATCMQMRSLTNRARPHEAMALGLDLLRQLGLETPQDVGGAIAERIGAVMGWVSTLDQSGDLTRMEARDPRVLAVAKLLDETQPAALACNPALYAWLALENQHLWVEHGPCPQLIASLCAITAHVIAMCQDYRAAYAIAQHVRAVNEARHYETAKPMAGVVLATFTDHWFEPLDNNISHAQMARETLLQQGNLLYACFTYYCTLPALLDCVPSLDACADEFESALAFAARTGNDHAGAVFVPYRQLLRTLRGETEAPGSFDSDDFNEAAHLSGLDANPTAAAYYQITRALSAALFGDVPGLVRHASAAMPLLVNTPGFYVTALAHLLQALSLADRIKAVEPSQTNTLLAGLDTCRDWLTARAADAPMNFLHLSKWIDAERAWATGDTLGAIAGFDAALREVAPRQRPWHRALMTERAGLFHLAHGLEHGGRHLLTEAHRLYKDWGAGAKAEQMATRFAFLRTTPVRRRDDKNSSGNSSSHSGSHGSVSANSLDLIAILRASQALSSETDFARLRVRMAELVRELSGATHIRSVLWYEDKQEWCLPPPLDQGETARPIPVEEASQQGLLPLSVLNYVVRTREPLLVDDALKDDRFRHDPYFAGVACCSLLGVPVFNQGVMRLVVLLENRLSHGAFTADRLEAVNLIAGQLAVSIDNALLYDSLERKVRERTRALEEANQRLAALSITDALTRLANRRRFNEVFEAEWQRAIRPQTSLAVVMIDIDQFKLYNDHYGHQGGDECLRKVAAALQTSVRGDADLVARYGGEEFVLVLPNADLAAAEVVAERARAVVEALNEPHEQAGHGIVTISLGVAATVPTAQGDAEHLIELADAALYRAKKNGRNQVAGRRDH